jgi:transposase
VEVELSIPRWTDASYRRKSMSDRGKSRGGRPSKYAPEFRRDAVAMVLDEHRSIADVARALGVNEGTLGNWVAKERVERGERAGLAVDERAELAELRGEVAQQLRMERDLLKRSMAFWVKETERHEAFPNRAVMGGHRHRVVAAAR